MLTELWRKQMKMRNDSIVNEWSFYHEKIHVAYQNIFQHLKVLKCVILMKYNS